MTAKYSDSTKKIVDDYLHAVRDRLRASESVDADEVLDELRVHIENELAGLDQPVSQADVDEVIYRLGPPEQVVSEEDMPWWRKMILRLRRGPEDWRLEYLSLGVLILGILMADRFGVIITLFASFLLSRAVLSLPGEPDPPAKKWLIYPSLIITYLLVGFFVLLGPGLGVLCGLGTWLNDSRSMLYREPLFVQNSLGTVIVIMAGTALAIAIWWSLLWAAGRHHASVLRAFLEPFAEKWTGRTFCKLLLLIWVLTIVLVGSAVLLWKLT